MPRLTLLLAAALAPLTTSVAVAQVRLPTQPPIRQFNTPVRPSGDTQPIPAAFRPPPGMCRIWLEGVPPAQQPAPTDCASAVRNRPSNGKVIFGDDYIERRDDRDGKNKKPSDDLALVADAAPSTLLAVATSPWVHGPNADESLADPRDFSEAPFADAASVETFSQPPATRRRTAPARPVPARPRVARPDTATDDDEVAPPDSRTLSERRAAARTDRRDSARDAQQRRRDEWEARRRGTTRDDGDWTSADNRDGLSPLGRDDRRADGRRTDDRRSPDGRYADGTNGGAYGGAYGVYGGSYGPGYAPPARANGVCLDRDGDGWCDDVRTGGGYCRDVDGDGRCDDYPGLASAPYGSALPPMRAASDVQRGAGSEAALRWLGTGEVTVRTSELKRTGSPYRAMWLDANTGRLLQVWTDRDGDGIADRVEIYRNGRIAKTIGR